MHADAPGAAVLRRTARFAFIPSADTVFYLMGSGEYDELGRKSDWRRGGVKGRRGVPHCSKGALGFPRIRSRGRDGATHHGDSRAERSGPGPGAWAGPEQCLRLV